MPSPPAATSRRPRPVSPSPGARRPPPPPVDERLVMPESRFEIINGKVHPVPPADEPHGTAHARLSALLEAHAAGGYAVACDMLTRTSEKGDMAPDASVFPAARDPETGGRRLEELAFEIVSTERLSHAATKARALTRRGVRRVFAVDVEHRSVLEWSRHAGAWQALPPESVLRDPALGAPLPARVLVDTARADDAIAAALIARKNPVIESAVREGEARGRALGVREGEARGRALGVLEGKLAALLAVLSARGLPASGDQERRLRAAADAAQLDRWLAAAPTVPSVDALLEPR